MYQDLVSSSKLATTHAKLLQLHLTICNPMDYNPLGSSVHGILQASILEWVTMPSSRDLQLYTLENTQYNS